MKTQKPAQSGNIIFLACFLFTCINWSCKKEDDPPRNEFSDIKFSVEYTVGSNPLIFDSLMYHCIIHPN